MLGIRLRATSHRLPSSVAHTPLLALLALLAGHPDVQQTPKDKEKKACGDTGDNASKL